MTMPRRAATWTSITPQMIVNGSKQMVGSQRSEVYAVLDQSRQARWPVELG